MKVGDLIKVRYVNSNPYDSSFDHFGGDHIGVVTQTPNCHEFGIYQMWCINTETMHVLMPERDFIEVLSESG